MNQPPMDEDDSPYCIRVDRQSDAPEADDTEIFRVLKAVLRAEECPAAEIGISLADEDTVRDLNRRYLGRDEDTDVLAFDLSESSETLTGPDASAAAPEETRTSGFTVEGEIVANVDRARRQAVARSISPSAEVMLYLVHGCLHLLGYDDVEPEQADRMHKREDELLHSLGYGRVYAAADDEPEGAA